MNKKMLVLSAAMVAMFAIACGGNEEEPTFGALDVQVLGLEDTGPDAVESIEVTLKGQYDYETLLTKAGDGKWSGRFVDVATGPYTARATAYGKRDGEDVTVVLFVSEDVTVNIQPTNSSLSFVLNQHLVDEVDVPRFVSIQLDRTAVEQGQTVKITAQIKAKELAGLCGKYSGSYADPATDKLDAYGNAAFIADDWPAYCSSDFTHDKNPAESCDEGVCTWTAETTWTANKNPGAVWFVVRAITGEAVVEMGVVIVVTPPRVEVPVEAVKFNLAPAVGFHPVRVLSGASTTAYFAFTVNDSDGDVGYEFTDECGCVYTGHGASGSISSDAPKRNVNCTIASAIGESCDVTLKLTDGGGSCDPDGICSTTTVKITIPTEAIGVTEDRTEFVGFPSLPATLAKDTAHVFKVSPNLPAADPVVKVTMRMALYDPNGNPVPDFARHGTDLEADGPYAVTDQTKNNYLLFDALAEANAGEAPFDGSKTWYFQLRPITPTCGGNATYCTYRMVVEFINVVDGSTVAGDAVWVYVNK